MVDLETWDRLTAEEQREFDRLLPQLVQAVVISRARDGSDFAEMYRVEGGDQDFYITDGAAVLGDMRHQSRAVMEALFKEAAMNYGR
jgi:hypothetical protein